MKVQDLAAMSFPGRGVRHEPHQALDHAWMDGLTAGSMYVQCTYAICISVSAAAGRQHSIRDVRECPAQLACRRMCVSTHQLAWVNAPKSGITMKGGRRCYRSHSKMVTMQHRQSSLPSPSHPPATEQATKKLHKQHNSAQRQRDRQAKVFVPANAHVHARACVQVYANTHEQKYLFTERKSRLQGTAFWGPEVALLGGRDRRNEINTYDVPHFLLVQAWTRLNHICPNLEDHIEEL